MATRQRTTTSGSVKGNVLSSSKPYVKTVAKKSNMSAKAIAEKALALAQQTQKQIEKKNVDFLGASTVGTTATSFHFTGIDLSDLPGDRISNQIMVNGLAINYSFHRAVATTDSVNVRFIIFQDTQTIGDTTTFSWTTVMATAQPYSMINRDTAKNRFRILHSGMRLLTPTDDNLQASVFIPIKKLVEYNGSNAGDIQKNGIYGLAISDNNTNQPAFSYYSRIYYTDS